jgi:hypothetical protein
MLVRLACITPMFLLLACISSGRANETAGRSRGGARGLGGQSNWVTKISVGCKAFRNVRTLLPNASRRRSTSKADRSAALVEGG